MRWLTLAPCAPRRTCAGHEPCRQPRGYHRSDTGLRARHNHPLPGNGSPENHEKGQASSHYTPPDDLGCSPFRPDEKRYRAVVRHWSEDHGESGGRDGTAAVALVAPVSPKPCRLGLAGAPPQEDDVPASQPECHRRKSTVCQNMPPDGIRQRLQQAVDLPTHSASVERSGSSPSRSKNWLSR